MEQYKAIKKLGQLTVDEMDAMNEGELKKVIVEANTSMKQVKEELEANPNYRQAKSSVDALSQGKKDVDARQKVRISYSLELLERFGKMDEVERAQWNIDNEQRLKAVEAKKKAKAEEEAAKAPSAVRHLKSASEVATGMK